MKSGGGCRNLIGSPRLIHPDEEFINSFMAEPRQYHHHRRCNNTNGSSGFDYEFDFDQKSRLGSKKLSNQAAAISINGDLKFHRSDDEHLTPSYNNHLPFETHWCLKELRGRIYALAKDQNGCRILQALFERPIPEEVELVLSEVVDSISDLMKDQFGNYLFQKLVALMSPPQTYICPNLSLKPLVILIHRRHFVSTIFIQSCHRYMATPPSLAPH